MMLYVILSLLYAVSAQAPSPMPVYSRIYLRGLKSLEDERVKTDFIDKGITYIKDEVFKAAKQGLVKYTTERFEGCEAYARPNELAPFGFNKEICENIVNRLHTLVSESFPDSEFIYDANTKKYTIKWD